MSDHVTKLIVHPGIGDLSWLFSKLSTTGEQVDLVIAEDAKTRRAMPLASMIPCVRHAEYGGMDAYAVLAKCGNTTWAEYKKAEKDGLDLYMTANWWLDAGNRLEGYLPDLDTDFHYPIVIPDEVERWADTQTEGPDNVFGIYTASAMGIAAWNAWSVNEWTDFILKVYEAYPNTRFVLMGARWDMDVRVLLLDALQRNSIPYDDMFGRTTLQQAVALIKRFNYFAGYASGLTILADVVNTPVCMLYPEHLTKLATAWPDPVNMATGQYRGLAWKRPVTVFELIRPQLERYMK